MWPPRPAFFDAAANNATPPRPGFMARHGVMERRGLPTLSPTPHARRFQSALAAHPLQFDKGVKHLGETIHQLLDTNGPVRASCARIWRGLQTVGLVVGDWRVDRALPQEPQGYVELQGLLAVVVAQLDISETHPVSQAWLNPWSPERLSLPEQEPLVNAAQARYILATTGWPRAASIGAIDVLRQTATRAPAASLPLLDLCLLVLQTKDPQVEADLATVLQEMMAVPSAPHRYDVAAGKLLAHTVRTALPLEARQTVVRHLLRAPQQSWRELGLGLMDSLVEQAPPQKTSEEGPREASPRRRQRRHA